MALKYNHIISEIVTQNIEKSRCSLRKKPSRSPFWGSRLNGSLWCRSFFSILLRTPSKSLELITGVCMGMKKFLACVRFSDPLSYSHPVIKCWTVVQASQLDIPTRPDPTRTEPIFELAIESWPRKPKVVPGPLPYGGNERTMRRSIIDVLTLLQSVMLNSHTRSSKFSFAL